jgi:hypothetical protein
MPAPSTPLGAITPSGGPVGLEPTTYGEMGVHRLPWVLPVAKRACQDQSGRLAASWEGSVTASWRPERRITSRKRGVHK